MCHKLRQGGETWCSLNVWHKLRQGVVFIECLGGVFNHKLCQGGYSVCIVHPQGVYGY